MKWATTSNIYILKMNIEFCLSLLPDYKQHHLVFSEVVAWS